MINNLDKLRVYIEKKGGQVLAAKALGVQQPYISSVLNGKKPMSKEMGHALGIEPKTVWVRIK